MFVTLLLVVCAAKGIWFNAGISVPVDPDIVRDIGFIQGLRDGNLLGDPANPDALRWYPPLFHVLAAGVSWLSGQPVLSVWPKAGLWLNLLSPIAFYLMNIRLIGRWPACFATGVFVLFNSAIMAGDEAAGYTPWTYTPALAWPLFFGGVWLIHRRAQQFRSRDALLIGAVIGLVFLAHTVPALLLAAIVSVIGLRGVLQPETRLRAVGFLTLVGLVALICSLPFLLPLILEYHLRIANPVPGAWVHPLLLPEGTMRLLLVNLPGVLALVVAWASRDRNRLPAATYAILLTWIGTCLFFLARHEICSAIGSSGGACGVLVIAAHHYHVYLQAAWASLIGYSIWLVVCAIDRPRRLVGAGVPALAAMVIGTTLLFVHPRDQEIRGGFFARPDLALDRLALIWILAHSSPTDPFVTELPAEPDQMGTAAAIVMAAGRRLVAPPRIHANPYVAWPPMNDERLMFLAAFRRGDDPALCRFLIDLASHGQAWFLLPASFAARSRVTRLAWSDDRFAIHTISALACAPDGEVQVLASGE